MCNFEHERADKDLKTSGNPILNFIFYEISKILLQFFFFLDFSLPLNWLYEEEN